MARLCFTWELGQGYGHLVRYRGLIERLVLAGHAVTFITRDLDRAQRVFGDMAVQLLPIEPGSTPQSERLVQLNSYPEILHDFGFRSPTQLRKQLQPWLEYLDRLRPDAMIIDHSPTALIAARITGTRFVSSGNGFTVPPRVTPMPPLRSWSSHLRERLVEHEQHVLGTCNTVLAGQGAPRLGAVAELLEANCEWLLSFAELDHYGERDGARYLGSFPASDFGAEPHWQATSGPKLFAYLSTPTVNEALLDALGAVGANVCIHAPQLAAKEISRLDPGRTVVEMQPVDIAAAASAADAVITNGGLNSVSAFLAAGVPQLALPDNLERHMVGRRLELAGGGLMAPWRHPGRLPEKLRAVISDRTFARAAERFAAKYASATAAQQTESMLADLQRLLSR